MRKSNELQIGKAGEYIVCADLIIKGFVAYPSEQGLPYDVVLDTGEKLLRCQVKTTEKPREIPQRNKKSVAYIFNVKRRGSNGKSQYKKNDADIFALVALDTRQVAYVKSGDLPTTLFLRSDSRKGTYHDEIGIKDYADVMKHSAQGKTQTEISKILGKHIATVNRMCKPGYKPHETKAKYFSHLIRGKDWFYGL